MEGCKICLKCGEEKEAVLFSKDKQKKDGLQSYCKSCCSIVNKEYRHLNSDRLNSYYKKYTKKTIGKIKTADRSRKNRLKFPRQYAAKNKINHLIERGKLTRPTVCEQCSCNAKTQAHHHDYLKPLDVTFLCIKCHRAWHKENTPLNKG